jgi:S-adenosylmethionine:diacylglycerol 3-amino-3-carboxypropyl transferase
MIFKLSYFLIYGGIIEECVDFLIDKMHLQKLYYEKMEKMLKNIEIVESQYMEFLCKNNSHLVLKSIEDMRFIMKITKVNKFLKQIPFRLEKVS